MSARSQAPPLAIQRRYQPAASALDDLVEVLYQLLAHSGDDEQTVISSVSAQGRDSGGAKGAR